MSFNALFFGREIGVEKSGVVCIAGTGSTAGGSDVVGTTLIVNHDNVMAKGDSGKLSFTKGSGGVIFALRTRRKTPNVHRAVRWCNGNTAPFGGVILGSNPSRTANLPCYCLSSSASPRLLMHVSDVTSFFPLPIELRFNQTSRIPMSAGDTPEMRAA